MQPARSEVVSIPKPGARPPAGAKVCKQVPPFARGFARRPHNSKDEPSVR